jgi:hypothetical protein
MMIGLFVDDEDEEDDKSVAQKVGQAMTSGATSLILGRDFGNATKSIINYGVERMNEEFLDGLRNAEYDPYKDAVAYTPWNKQGNTSMGDYLVNMMGPVTPIAKTASLIVKKATEEPKKKAEAIERREREINLRIPLEILGNTGYIPLYKDVRKIIMADIYKGMKKELGKQKQPSSGGGMGKEDMKRYFPEMYEQMYGKKSPTYEYEQQLKKYEKEMNLIEKRMKAEMYNYRPKQSD